jgi:tetratricopeptide (TPR) repeat protein
MMHEDSELEMLEPALARFVQGVPDSPIVLASLRGAVRARLERLEPARDDLRAAWAHPGAGRHTFLPQLAEIAVVVGQLEICDQCHALLLPLTGKEWLGGHVSVSYEGPIDRLLGLLEFALGRAAEAEQKLRATLALAERRGFDAWVAQGRYDLAGFLSATGRAREAIGFWQGAAELAEKCDMVGLVKRAGARLAAAGSAPVSVRLPPSAPVRLVMQRQGELYLIEHGALSARIRATRGAELLSRLIEAPDQEIHVLALASDDGVATAESNAGESVDRTALRQYRSRLEELEELLAEAESRADRGRIDALQREKVALEREISRALGLGGRTRQAGSATERARVNVQRRLKDALERIAEASPELGAWLGRCVRTGTYCSFHSTP